MQVQTITGPTRARRHTLGYSEVCVHLGVAGREMWVAGADGPLYGGVDIVAKMVQLFDEFGQPFSFPITRGEAGFTL